jgi:hypothetical protein
MRGVADIDQGMDKRTRGGIIGNLANTRNKKNPPIGVEQCFIMLPK